MTCTEKIWHGPGHQSSTHCRVRGEHVVHEAVYGEFNQFAQWRTRADGKETFSGVFDEPPAYEDDTVTDHPQTEADRELADFLAKILSQGKWQRRTVPAYVVDVVGWIEQHPGEDWQAQLKALEEALAEHEYTADDAWIIAVLPDGTHVRLDPWRPGDPRP